MKNIILTIIVSLTLISCGGGGGESGNSSSSNSYDTTFNKSQRDFLYSLFKTEYLWADKVEEADYDNYTNAQTMIDAFSNEKDKWSYYETIKENENWQNQRAAGFGCYFKNTKIYKIKFNSPCEKAGLKRGDIVKKIDGEDGNFKLYNEAENNIGIESIFTIERNGLEQNIAITPEYYTFKAVKYQIIPLNGQKIGHLIFDSFTSASIDELEDAFNFFKDSNVDELIIDLRYNDGGSLATASILLDKIAGYNNENSLQAHLKWNNNYSVNDEYYYFEEDNNSLNSISRVYFLTTNRTASASEMIINSLKPYLNDVVLIGSKTHGKPVGMKGRQKNGLIYWLINFSIYNANDEGDYFNGLDVTCSVQDEYNYPRTDNRDALFKKALFHIENGTCN